MGADASTCFYTNTVDVAAHTNTFFQANEPAAAADAHAKTIIRADRW